MPRDVKGHFLPQIPHQCRWIEGVVHLPDGRMVLERPLRFEHEGPPLRARAVASPDGRHVAWTVGSHDRVEPPNGSVELVFVSESATGRRVGVVALDHVPNDLALGDDLRLATAHGSYDDEGGEFRSPRGLQDACVREWDGRTGALLGTRPEGWVVAGVVATQGGFETRDDRCDDSRVRLDWDPARKDLAIQVDEHDPISVLAAPAPTVAFLRGDALLVGRDDRTRLLSVETGAVLDVFEGMPLGFGPLGPIVQTADHVVVHGTPARRIVGRWARLDPSGTRVAVRRGDERFLVELDSGEAERVDAPVVAVGPTAHVEKGGTLVRGSMRVSLVGKGSSFAFSPCGRWLVRWTLKALVVFDATTGARRWSAALQWPKPAFSPSGDTLCVEDSYLAKNVVFFDVETGEPEGALRMPRFASMQPTQGGVVLAYPEGAVSVHTRE